MTWKKKIAGTAAMFILGFIFILPVLWIVMNSIKTSPEIAADFLALPKSLYLDNFKNAMESMNFLVALKNSVVITLGAMLGGLFVSFAGAFGISHLRGKISQNLYLYFVFGQIVPFHAVMIPISVLATNTNLTAAIDGCGVFRIMTQIVFPLVKPATVTIGVLFFMWSWNDFLLPSILIGDSELRPLTVNLFMFRSATSTQWNLFIAGLTLCIIPTIILYICAQKYITSGLTMGAVK